MLIIFSNQPSDKWRLTVQIYNTKKALSSLFVKNFYYKF